MKKIIYLLLACHVCTLLACTKGSGDDGDGANCANIQAAKASTNGPVTIGETLTVQVPEVGGYRIYTWSGPNNFNSQEPDNTITDVTLANEGWHYVAINNPDCDGKYDSVYVDVKLKQESPTCTPPVNAATYSNLFDDTFTMIDKGIDPTYSMLELEGDGPADRLQVLFHPFWKNKEPEDGVYITTNVPSFSQTDGVYNRVFVNTTKQSVYFSSYESQKVYVSHVGDKLKVSVCSLNMGGYNGNSYTTAVTASMTEK